MTAAMRISSPRSWLRRCRRLSPRHITRRPIGLMRIGRMRRCASRFIRPVSTSTAISIRSAACIAGTPDGPRSACRRLCIRAGSIARRLAVRCLQAVLARHVIAKDETPVRREPWCAGGRPMKDDGGNTCFGGNFHEPHIVCQAQRRRLRAGSGTLAPAFASSRYETMYRDTIRPHGNRAAKRSMTPRSIIVTARPAVARRRRYRRLQGVHERPRLSMEMDQGRAGTRRAHRAPPGRTTTPISVPTPETSATATASSASARRRTAR